MDEPEAILARAARAAFARYGVRRATVADVAEEAGIVRQTVYNTVSGRAGLVELAIVQVCEELKIELDAQIGELGDVDDALVQFLARAIELMGAHAELNELMGALTEARLEELFGHSHPIEVLIRDALRPILDEAERVRRLRSEITVDEATRWLQGVLTFALLHDAPDGESLRRDIRVFALPSVLTSR